MWCPVELLSLISFSPTGNEVVFLISQTQPVKRLLSSPVLLKRLIPRPFATIWITPFTSIIVISFGRGLDKFEVVALPNLNKSSFVLCYIKIFYAHGAYPAVLLKR